MGMQYFLLDFKATGPLSIVSLVAHLDLAA
jgi:hypothetical protein